MKACFHAFAGMTRLLWRALCDGCSVMFLNLELLPSITLPDRSTQDVAYLRRASFAMRSHFPPSAQPPKLSRDGQPISQKKQCDAMQRHAHPIAREQKYQGVERIEQGA